MGARSASGGALLCLVLGLGTAHAEATGAGPACGPPAAKGPSSAARTSGPPLQVTDGHTAARPLTVEYEHRPGGNVFHQAGVNGDLVHTTVQVGSAAQRSHLWVRATFPGPVTDVDLYVFDSRGRMRAASESSNNDVLDRVGGVIFYDPETGGPGFENVDALPVRRCETFVLETENSLVLTSTPVTLTVWLAPPPE